MIYIYIIIIYIYTYIYISSIYGICRMGNMMTICWNSGVSHFQRNSAWLMALQYSPEGCQRDLLKVFWRGQTSQEIQSVAIASIDGKVPTNQNLTNHSNPSDQSCETGPGQLPGWHCDGIGDPNVENMGHLYPLVNHFAIINSNFSEVYGIVLNRAIYSNVWPFQRSKLW